jgi:hypothetical protein
MAVDAEPCCFGVRGERKVFGPNILQEPEKQVRIVKENLQIAQSRQLKSYTGHGTRELSFEV